MVDVVELMGTALVVVVSVEVSDISELAGRPPVSGPGGLVASVFGSEMLKGSK